jgi:hypothetical protein
MVVCKSLRLQLLEFYNISTIVDCKYGETLYCVFCRTLEETIFGVFLTNIHKFKIEENETAKVPQVSHTAGIIYDVLLFISK